MRFYMAITNDCSHKCEYCSCYSRPNKKTYMSLPTFKKILGSSDGDIEVQFEGGEPLLHPDFYKMVEYCIRIKRCSRIIITTNSSEIEYGKEHEWMDFIRNNKSLRFTLKPSINKHLYDNQDNLFEKMSNILSESMDIKNLKVIFNVRLDKSDDDLIIMSKIESFGLKDHSNIFYFQKYGYASNVDRFEEPFIISNPVDFCLISPDGKDFGMDMIARSEYMKYLK